MTSRDLRLSANQFLVVLLISLVFLGVLAFVVSLIEGMEVLEFSDFVPWTMIISLYLFFISSSVGVWTITSLGPVFGLKRYKLIGKRGAFLAISLMIFAFLSVLSHLGHPERAPLFTLLTPNYRSAMWGIGVIYSIYAPSLLLTLLLLLGTEFQKKVRSTKGIWQKIYSLLSLAWLNRALGERGIKLVSFVALGSGLVAITVESSLFAHVEANPFWHGPVIPIYFTMSSLSLGLAWLIFMLPTINKLRNKSLEEGLKELLLEMAEILIVFLLINLLFIIFKMYTGLFDPIKAKTVSYYLYGPLWVPFWLFELTLGIFIPLVMLLGSISRRKVALLPIAGSLILFGNFMGKYNFVVAGQVWPYLGKIPSVYPAWLEVFLVLGIGAGFFLLYLFGVRFLPLEENLENLTKRG